MGHTWLADDKMCTPCLVLLQWGNKDVWYFRVVSSEINHRLSHISQICSGFITGRVPLKFIKQWQFHFLVLFRFSVLFICRKWVYVVKQNFKENLLFKHCSLPLKKWQVARFFYNGSNSPRDNIPKQSWDWRAWLPAMECCSVEQTYGILRAVPHWETFATVINN